jgi:hypothetical protein
MYINIRTTFRNKALLPFVLYRSIGQLHARLGFFRRCPQDMTRRDKARLTTARFNFVHTTVLVVILCCKKQQIYIYPILSHAFLCSKHIIATLVHPQFAQERREGVHINAVREYFRTKDKPKQPRK